MVATASWPSQQFEPSLDALLTGICEELQLSENRYKQAEERYLTVGSLLDSPNSPFRIYAPRIYPQGSMLLNTTVKPIKGPHDLDFVLQLTTDYKLVNPMALIDQLFSYLRSLDRYSSLVSKKNRCVRIEYANEFYMDILPACSVANSGTCIKVPDRKTGGWKDSNPLGYGDWFQKRSRLLAIPKLAMDKAMDIPDQQAVAEKYPLQLAVQLAKRERDVRFTADNDFAPISIVITTLYGLCYAGEQSVSQALQSILHRIIERIDEAKARGSRLYIFNPANPDEELSERWTANLGAYAAFVNAIRSFSSTWDDIIAKRVEIVPALENLFGETVQPAYRKFGQRLQEARKRSDLSVKPTGTITGIAAGLTIPRNTFFGDE